MTSPVAEMAAASAPSSPPKAAAAVPAASPKGTERGRFRPKSSSERGMPGTERRPSRFSILGWMSSGKSAGRELAKAVDAADAAAAPLDEGAWEARQTADAGQGGGGRGRALGTALKQRRPQSDAMQRAAKMRVPDAACFAKTVVAVRRGGRARADGAGRAGAVREPIV